MEPLSFASSLITVVGLVAASSKQIHDLRRKLSNAPKDVEYLLEQHQTFESLLKEMETQLQDHRNGAPPQETLQRLWGNSLAQMQRDVQSLQSVLSKIEPLLRTASKSSKVVLLARQMLSEKEVQQYRRKIDTHCGTLTSIQAMVCDRKLGKVSESIVQLGNEDRAGFRKISSELSQSTSQLNSEVKAGFSAVASQFTISESANEGRHQTVLAHLNDHAERSADMNEAGFQAIRSSLNTARSSSSEENKTTRAILSQCQGQLQQILRDRVTFDTVEGTLHSPPIRRRAVEPNTTKTSVYWSHHLYRTPIGLLQIHLNQTRQTRKSRRSIQQVCKESEITVAFVPPRWLSKVAINYGMKISYGLISNQWHWGATLEPLTVNYNPIFIDAVNSVEVEGVRRSFAEGLAKPTDYILDRSGDPQHWYWFLGISSFESSDIVARCSLMLNFMTKYGLPGQEPFMRYFFRLLKEKSLEHQEILRNQLRNYLNCRGNVLTAESSVIASMCHACQFRIEWVPELLFNASKPLLVDDFSSLQICLIGTLAHVDAPFRDRLKKEMASYRSPDPRGRVSFADHLFETTFGTISIANHFHKLHRFEKYDFLSTVCRTGSVSMIKPFVDIGVDFDGDSWNTSSLGYAAAAGKIDIVWILLKAGANSSSAISTFLRNSRRLSEESFRRILELLVNNARPALLNGNDDPLLAILSSSRALCSYPMAPEILLDRKVYTKGFFGEEASKTWYGYSYMFQAISRRNPSVVDLLLQNGAQADVHISHYFHCWNYRIDSCTWITFSVICGTASCTDILIKHGADITALDEAGSSALQLAKNHALGPHSRDIGFIHLSKTMQHHVTADEDAETLAVVERAFNLRLQRTKSPEEHINLCNELTPQPPSRRVTLVSTLQNIFKNALRIFLTPSQTELLRYHLHRLYHDMRRTWSLSFHEASLMRFIYALSYALLLTLELHALIRGHKRIPMPSKFFLSTFALLALALIWGSSQAS